MKKILAAAAVAGLAGLTACSVATPRPDGATRRPAPATSSRRTSQASPSRSSGTSAAPQAGGVKEACELFNSLYAEYQRPAADANAYEDIYFGRQDAKDACSGNLKGLFTSLERPGHRPFIRRSSTGGEPDQASKDAVRDAVFANAGACTAEGVTLTL